MVHCVQKKFVCDYCSKAFCVRDGLKRHLRIHTGNVNIEILNELKFIIYILQAKSRLCVEGVKKDSINQEICEFMKRRAKNT